jgi:hypothetical protein
MRKYLVCACAALWGSFAFGQQPQSGTGEPAKSAGQQELTDLLDAKIKAEWQAIKTKDTKSLGELLAEEYVAVEADGGGERYKWKALSELEGSSVTDYSLSFLKVTPLCPDVALVRYEVFIKFPPNATLKFEKILVGEVWVKRERAWKALHYQETRVK